MKRLREWVSQKGNLALAAASCIALVGGVSQGKLFAADQFYHGDPQNMGGCNLTCSLSSVMVASHSGSYIMAFNECIPTTGVIHPTESGICELSDHTDIFVQVDLLT